MLRTDATQNTKNSLNEEGRLDHAAIDKMGKIVEMTDIIAFELKTGAVILT